MPCSLSTCHHNPNLSLRAHKKTSNTVSLEDVDRNSETKKGHREDDTGSPQSPTGLGGQDVNERV